MPLVPSKALCVVVILAAFIFTPFSVAAEELTLSEAINKAGLQRMLSQRIVKSYSQIGSGVLVDVARSQLAEAVDRFENNIITLKAFAPTPEISAALASVEAKWGDFKWLALGKVRKINMNSLLPMGEDLLWLSHDVVILLEQYSGTPHGRLVNLSGRQRMLSQRLAKYYLMIMWGLDTPSVRGEMLLAQGEFSKAHKILFDAPENTDEINAELAAVQLQWEWFRNALELHGSALFGLIVVESNDAILHSMEKITKMYEDLMSTVQ